MQERAKNVITGVSKVGIGTILYPGEEFDLAKTSPVHRRTGYEVRRASRNGTVVKSFGSCKVTTLYNAYAAELEITMSFKSFHCTLLCGKHHGCGKYQKHKDLKFKNNLEYGIYGKDIAVAVSSIRKRN